MRTVALEGKWARTAAVQQNPQSAIRKMMIACTVTRSDAFLYRFVANFFAPFKRQGIKLVLDAKTFLCFLFYIVFDNSMRGEQNSQRGESGAGQIVLNRACALEEQTSLALERLGKSFPSTTMSKRHSSFHFRVKYTEY